MHVDRLRQRFLVAMGVSASFVACSKEKVGDTSAVATAAPLAAESARAPVTAQADAGTVNLARPPGLTGGGGCGFVIVCNPGAAAPVKDGASKPFERCAATVPEGDGETGSHTEGHLDEELTTARRKTTAGICCYKAPRRLCGGGRPLRADDGPVVAPSVRRDDWMSHSLCDGAVTADEALAAQWLVDAAAEHASVASFARASLQLLALGAPSELVAAVHSAALDEIAHARTCFALAARRGAPTSGPGPLAVDRAQFATSLDVFVRDTFLDGCVAETAAAIDVRRRAGEGDAFERAALLGIADDEDRHAELAWRMLAWAIRTGGAEARIALEAAVREVSASDDPIVAALVLPCVSALLGDGAASVV